MRDIGDARLEIDETLAAPSKPAEGPTAERRARWRAWVSATVGALAIAGAIIAIAVSRQSGADRLGRPLMQFAIALPPEHPIPPDLTSTSTVLAISPDGMRVAYVGVDGPTTRLYARTLDQLEFKPLDGTEGALNPFFSPDGAWIAFFAGGTLRKVPVRGGSTVALADVMGTAVGGSWNADDTLVFQRGFTLGVFRVRASGGSPEVLITPDPTKRENAVVWPQLLPGGGRLLFTVSPDSIASFDDAQIAVQPIGSPGERSVLAGGTGARYLPTGHLIFGHRETILAAAFDPSERQLKGVPVPVVEGVSMNITTGAVQAAIAAQAGTLAYVPVVQSSRPESLVVVDRAGHVQPLREVESFYAADLSMSPDGQRLAIRVAKANDDIHVYDFASGALSRVTFEGGDEQCPVWAPDGRRLAYSSAHGHAANMFLKVLDSNTPPEPILKSEKVQYPSSFSPDGKLLAYNEIDEKTGYDIWVVRLEGDRTARPFAHTEFEERRPAFSSDGHWIAYESDESRDTQVYIAKYPDGSGKIQVSIEGGTEPVWALRPVPSRDGTIGTELFYRNGDKLMAVAVKATPTLVVGKPRLLFEGNFKATAIPAARSFAPLPDGQRFVFERAGSQREPVREIRLLLNWFEELKRLVPIN